MAGFAVGVVERKRVITGSTIEPGNVILGLGSSGLHSNGYTLVRHICFKQEKLNVRDCIDELGGAELGEVLLTPTRIYVKPVISVLSAYKVKKVIHGMAHITGSGLVGNIPRVLPANCNAAIKKGSWPIHPVFHFLQKRGPVEEEEMYRVFNMGIGFVLIVSADFADSIKARLEKAGESVYKIGTIVPGTGKVVLK
jgi:phosphoribosylformylglycinamidine cyclo-ligase